MKAIFIFILVTLFFYLTPSVSAHNSEIGASRISPASPLYFLKSVREILELKFAPSTGIRASRQLEFATRRIRETVSLSGDSKENLIAPTMEKYWSHLRELFGITDLHNENQLLQIQNSLKLHADALEDLYFEISDPRAQRSVRTSIFRISVWENDLIEKLLSVDEVSIAEQFREAKINACTFLANEASSSALNEIERSLFAERSGGC